MKVINKDVLDLLWQIQGLVLQIKDTQLYYQQNVNLFQVYIIKEKEHIYNKSVYIDGHLSDEETVIKNLKQIIEDLEDFKEEQ
jgi:hypothetical protein